jgi:hypothetical protein
VTVSDPELGQIPMPGVVPTFSRTPGRIVHAGPRLGEYNDEVFAGMLGLSRDEMARLEREDHWRCDPGGACCSFPPTRREAAEGRTPCDG